MAGEWPDHGAAPRWYPALDPLGDGDRRRQGRLRELARGAESAGNAAGSLSRRDRRDRRDRRLRELLASLEDPPEGFISSAAWRVATSFRLLLAARGASPILRKYAMAQGGRAAAVCILAVLGAAALVFTWFHYYWLRP